jgi:hypothetical protein
VPSETHSEGLGIGIEGRGEGQENTPTVVRNRSDAKRLEGQSEALRVIHESRTTPSLAL